LQYLVDLLRAGLLAAHLLASALAATGPVLCVLFRLVPTIREQADDALRRLAKWSLVALAAGLVIGLASGGWLCLAEASPYRQAVLRFPGHAYSMLAIEWLFTAVLYIAYLALWHKLRRGPALWLHAVVGVAAATNLLYHFPTMMVLLGRLAAEPSFTLEAEITRPVFRQLITAPDLLARVGHFWSLSLLVAGVAAVDAAAREKPSPTVGRLVVGGAAAGLLGLVLMVVSGMVTLTQLPAAPQRALLGGNLLATTLFAAGVTAALALGYALLATAIDPRVPQLRRARLLLVVATLAMAAATQQAAPHL